MLVDIINEQVKTTRVYLMIINNIANEKLLNRISSEVVVIRINRRPASRTLFPLFRINYILLRMDFDILHCHNENCVQLLLPQFRRSADITIHDTRVSSQFLVKYRKVYSISDTVQRDVLKNCGLHSEVINNGIDTSAIKVKKITERSDLFKIVQVGRLHTPKKGQHVLISAIKKLVYEKNLTKIRLDFIGEGDSFSDLAELVQKYRLGDFVSFLGLKDRVYIFSHLCDYDLLVQPSLYEGFGLTVAEAMTAKIPVLVSDIEGPMEIIDNGKFGYFFKSEDVGNLTERIVYIFDNYNTQENLNMVDLACQYVASNFDIKNTAAKYLSAYCCN